MWVDCCFLAVVQGVGALAMIPIDDYSQLTEIIVYKVMYDRLAAKMINDDQETIDVWLAAGWFLTDSEAWSFYRSQST